MKPLRSLALAAVLTCAPHAAAQCPILTVPQGSAAAVSGDTAIVAVVSYPSIEVRILERGGPAGWIETFATPFDGLVVFLPIDVAIDGDTAIVGNPEADGAGFFRGRAVVLERADAGWTETELVASNSADADFFGSSVDIDGDVAVVGALHQCGIPVGNEDYLGRAYVFERRDGVWTEAAELLPVGSFIGGSVAVSGDRIVVGSPLDPALGHWAGAARVYVRTASGWSEEATLVSSAPEDDQHFGATVEIEGEAIFVGAPYGYYAPTLSSLISGVGFVDVFERRDGSWTNVQTLSGLGGARGAGAFDGFGAGLVRADDRLLVLAPLATDGLQLFRQRTGAWVAEQTWSTAAGSFFTWELALDDNVAIVSDAPGATFWSLGIANAESYCASVPNSTGAAGVIGAVGCDSVAAGDLTLQATSLPAGEPGLFLLGSGASQLPFGGGFLCVAPPVLRFPSGIVDGAGTLTRAVDFDVPPASLIDPGSIAWFQALHADAAAGVGSVNLTDGLALAVEP